MIFYILLFLFAIFSVGVVYRLFTLTGEDREVVLGTMIKGKFADTVEGEEESPDTASLLRHDMKGSNFLHGSNLTRNNWLGLGNYVNPIGKTNNTSDKSADKLDKEELDSNIGARGSFGDVVKAKDSGKKMKKKVNGDSPNVFDKDFKSDLEPKYNEYEPVKVSNKTLEIKPEELKPGKDYSKGITHENKVPNNDSKTKENKISEDGKSNSEDGKGISEDGKSNSKNGKGISEGLEDDKIKGMVGYAKSPFTNDILGGYKSPLATKYLENNKVLSTEGDDKTPLNTEEESKKNPLAKIIEKAKKGKYLPKMALTENVKTNLTENLKTNLTENLKTNLTENVKTNLTDKKSKLSSLKTVKKSKLNSSKKSSKDKSKKKSKLRHSKSHLKNKTALKSTNMNLNTLLASTKEAELQ